MSCLKTSAEKGRMGQIREELAATQLYKELRRGEEKSGGRCVVKELDMRRKEGGRHT